MKKKNFRYIFEAAILWLFFRVMKILPLDAASHLGGKLGIFIGLHLGVTQTAIRNFSLAFPEKNDSEVKLNMQKMWENLGRTAAEYPLLNRFDCQSSNARITIEGLQNVEEIGKSKSSAIFFSGHFANWDLMPLTVTQNICKITVIYRSANNPFVDKMLLKARSPITDSLLSKGAASGRKIVELIKSGKSIAMLVDQKQNDGISVPFFGRQVMTAPAIARLALRYDVPLFPVSIARTHGTFFQVCFHSKMVLPAGGVTEENIHNLMLGVNKFLENTIRKNPSQWLWVHRRWNN